MDIFPAIDLQNGQCVRLTRGDFSTAILYETDPVAQARQFRTAGAEWLHIVDLDGARDGSNRQFERIAAIAGAVPLRLQVGGGIREASAIERLLDCDVERVVVGSLAAENPPLVVEWLARFGSRRIVAAFDVKHNETGDPEVLTLGWQKKSGKSLWQLLEGYGGSGLETILCTDIDRDGMLNGSNTELYAALRDRWPSLRVLASGGVQDMADLLELQRIGIAGAIVGKALYERRIELADAIARVKHVG
ncbi:MAG TPA: 1-(5-phosphoribosyl)-5-[(5-phosphoribosylamino)methylideneamino]imidazole-4-carboxamide isomerase [Rhizomicrobium sp.]|jgi:phosphoribosylformimino-5-aminoimidazole carboxamide ribotide isomerase